MSFSCQNVKLYSPEYVDGRLLPGDQYLISSHLSECEACTAYFEQVSTLRATVRSLPASAVPQSLQTKLRVLASKEQKSGRRTARVRVLCGKNGGCV
jgi:anti-sigma factor RsiW